MTKETVRIHNKDYETVASRVARFREEHKDKYGIVTEIIDRDEITVVMKASIILLDTDKTVATGFAEEKREASMINKTSALENCETSAIGRALAAFGIGGTEYASADEVANAIHQRNTPKETVKEGLIRLADEQGNEPASAMQKGTITSLLKRTGTNNDPDSIKSTILLEYGVDPLKMTKEQAREIIAKLNQKVTETSK